MQTTEVVMLRYQFSDLIPIRYWRNIAVLTSISILSKKASRYRNTYFYAAIRVHHSTLVSTSVYLYCFDGKVISVSEITFKHGVNDK